MPDEPEGAHGFQRQMSLKEEIRRSPRPHPLVVGAEEWLRTRAISNPDHRDAVNQNTPLGGVTERVALMGDPPAYEHVSS